MELVDEMGQGQDLGDTLRDGLGRIADDEPGDVVGGLVRIVWKGDAEQVDDGARTACVV